MTRWVWRRRVQWLESFVVMVTGSKSSVFGTVVKTKEVKRVKGVNC